VRASGPECEWSECDMHGANDWLGEGVIPTQETPGSV